ncbi:hypothetical protein EJ06DRAFT_417446 [Trichodelitschia bisporula]|uniref:Uncharacterized protein n=1 Tax=Trichodelitschia bisporula TaxID=703511 RepID=A0A6G1HYD5_9PEZI|nr:hypothetical protein EJ06DRAFT_417446 [Trichodelitschia bisporula]
MECSEALLWQYYHAVISLNTGKSWRSSIISIKIYHRPVRTGTVRAEHHHLPSPSRSLIKNHPHPRKPRNPVSWRHDLPAAHHTQRPARCVTTPPSRLASPSPTTTPNPNPPTKQNSSTPLP